MSLKQTDDWIWSKWTHWQSSLKKGSKNQDDIKLHVFEKRIQKENKKKIQEGNSDTEDIK